MPPFFSNPPVVSRRQAVASLLGPLSFQASLSLKESMGTGVLEALKVVAGWGLQEQALLPRWKSCCPNTAGAH